MNVRIGQGYDVHRIADGEKLWLGGILIPYGKGTIAHSDGDVLIHALCDALLGAANLGDIGTHFPDTSGEYENIDSKVLLERTCRLLSENGFQIVNVDTTICAQKPKLKEYIPRMESILAEVMDIEADRISIKATTTEGLGFVGREEGIAVHAVGLIEKIR